MMACTKVDVLAFPPMSLVRTCEREDRGEGEGRVERVEDEGGGGGGWK